MTASSTAANLLWLHAAEGTHRCIVQGTGNVGIGSASPTAQWSVAWRVALCDIGNGAGTASICTILATALLSTSTTACNPSSLRFKDNVEEILYGLDEVCYCIRCRLPLSRTCVLMVHRLAFSPKIWTRCSRKWWAKIAQGSPRTLIMRNGPVCSARQYSRYGRTCSLSLLAVLVVKKVLTHTSNRWIPSTKSSTLSLRNAIKKRGNFSRRYDRKCAISTYHSFRTTHA
jgi:hypothetical protein